MLNKAVRQFYSFISDPYFSFNYFNRDKRLSMKKGGKPWSVMKSQLDYMMGLLFDKEIVIAGGRGSGKTSSVEHMIFTIAISNPKKWTGYIVRNQRHVNALSEHLIEYFNKDAFTRTFLTNYDKKTRIFSFSNGHKVEIRIAGTDKTGSTTMVSGHYNFLFIDEAQLLPRKMLEELLPTALEGCKIVVAGVPNNIRDSILYYYVSRYSTDMSISSTMYYRYASYECETWDMAAELRARDIYGGEHTDSYKALVGGFWGDHASSVFRPSKLVDGLIDNPYFRYKSYKGNSFDDLFKQMNLPMIIPKYNFYVIGADIGVTNAPTHVIVLGVYKKKDKDKEVEHYDVMYRLEMEQTAPFVVSKALDYLMDYFSCKHCAIDAQTMGQAVYDNLVNREIFPATHVRNRMYIMPINFNKPVVMGNIQTIDQVTGREVNEEVKCSMKNASTMKIIELVEAERLHISQSETDSDSYDDMVTIMIAETQTACTKILHPFTYSNSVNEHCVDGLRCCGLVILLIVEKGLFRGGYGDPVRPVILKRSKFHDKSRIIGRRRR